MPIPEKLHQPLRPPTHHSSKTGTVPNVISKDAMGAGLVREEAFGIDAEFRVSDGMLDQIYWQDMREFYGIDAKDAEIVPLEVVASWYDFSSESRDHVIRTNIGSYTLNTAIENAKIKASSNQPEFYKKDLERDIEIVRDKLRVMLTNTEAQRILSKELDVYADVPPIFNYWRSQEDSMTLTPWHEWLTDSATPEQFMNFVQWHNFRMKRINDAPETKAVIAQEKQEYKGFIEKFAEQGVLSLRETTMDDLEHVHVVIADVFNTGIRGWAGYYPIQPNRNIRYVAVSNNFVKSATKHELNHAVLGEFKHRWLNEATTEHISVAMQNGEMHDTNALLDLGIYYEERLLLDLIMNYGKYDISLAILLYGYTEQKDDQSIDIFTEAVNMSWGEDALVKIQSAIVDHELRLILDGYSERDAQIRALKIVRSDLLQQPEVILGNSTKDKEKVSV